MSSRCYDGSLAGPNDLRLPRKRFNELIEAENRLRALEGGKPAREATTPTSSRPRRDSAARPLTPDAVGPLLELGLSDGRIGLADADHWRRSFETSPAEATRRFAQLRPNAERAEERAMAAYATDAVGRLGIAAEELI